MVGNGADHPHCAPLAAGTTPRASLFTRSCSWYASSSVTYCSVKSFSHASSSGQLRGSPILMASK